MREERGNKSLGLEHDCRYFRCAGRGDDRGAGGIEDICAVVVVGAVLRVSVVAFAGRLPA